MLLLLLIYTKSVYYNKYINNYSYLAKKTTEFILIASIINYNIIVVNSLKTQISTQDQYLIFQFSDSHERFYLPIETISHYQSQQECEKIRLNTLHL